MPSASVAPPALDNIVGSVTSPYRLVARTNETTWIRVRTEDGRMSEENVPPGEVREWISNRPFVLTVGNAGGVSLELNGRALPPLGPKGLVIQRIVLPPEAR
jgi:cytoskeleton protein RodZ